MAPAGQQIRIAIALAALRHKPSEQSIQAYIFDLQAAFPSSPAADRPRATSPNPWRDRVLALEKDIKELQEQYDKEQLELLALRKAARTNQAPAPHAGTNDNSEPLSDAPAPRKKAKTKKTTKAPTVDASSRPLTAPPAQAKLELSAIMDGMLADVPTASNVSTALEAFDTMTDMLADNPVSVTVELILSTTVRALRAIVSVLDLVIGVHLQEPSPNPKINASTGRPGSNSDPCDAATILGALSTILRRLVSTVLCSLRRHYTAGTQAKVKRKSALGRTRASQTQTAALNAMDGVLGGLYALVLAPIVRSVYPLSQSFVSACFGPCLEPGSRAKSARSNPHSGSGSKLPTDPRPAVLALLVDTLSALEEVLPGSPAAIPGVPTLGIGGSNAELIAAIPGAGQVKTLLALECVRELTKLYLPAPALPCTESEPPDLGSDSVATGRTGSTRSGFVNDSSADPGPGPSARESTWGRGDAANAKATGDRAGASSTSRGTHSWRTTNISNQHQPLPPRTFPGLAHVLYHNVPPPAAAGGSSSRDDSTRPGTPSHPMPSPSPSARAPSAAASWTVPHVPAAHGIFAGLRSRWAAVAGNLGETLAGATSDPARGPVQGGPPASLAMGSHAHAHAQQGARCPGTAGVGVGDLRERSARLARKDAVWYLCTALHRLLPAAPAPTLDSGADSPGPEARTRTATGASTCSTPPSSGPSTDPGGIQENAPSSSSSACAARADTAAEQAVYDALADLLRRTARPASSPPSLAMPMCPVSSPIVAGSHASSSSACCSSGHAEASSSSLSSSPSASAANADAFGHSRWDSSPTGPLSRARPAGAPSACTPRDAGGTNPGTGTGSCEPPSSSSPNAAQGAHAHTGETGEAGTAEYLRKRNGTQPPMQRLAPGREEGEAKEARMGEVERGMLLAVLERAWLGV